jgi:hypothetical protein
VPGRSRRYRQVAEKSFSVTPRRDTMAKKEELDEETLALIHWCIEVEGFLVAGGATQKQAQEHIEEEVEWFTDQFYDGLTPEEAAKEALA